MMLKTGDRVAVTDDQLEGTVVSIEGAVVTIETADGFLLDFESKELVKIGATSDFLVSDPLELSRILREKESGKKPSPKRTRPKERNTPPMEVDLHGDKLVRSPKSMEPYEMLTLQLETAKRRLEFAMRKRIPKIVFIHGVGEGVLKAELDYLLSRYDNIKFYDADYKKYGLGATEVYFLQNY